MIWGFQRSIYHRWDVHFRMFEDKVSFVELSSRLVPNSNIFVFSRGSMATASGAEGHDFSQFLRVSSRCLFGVREPSPTSCLLQSLGRYPSYSLHPRGLLHRLRRGSTHFYRPHLDCPCRHHLRCYRLPTCSTTTTSRRDWRGRPQRWYDL
jgi:hypothetical protein